MASSSARREWWCISRSGWWSRSPYWWARWPAASTDSWSPASASPHSSPPSAPCTWPGAPRFCSPTAPLFRTWRARRKSGTPQEARGPAEKADRRRRQKVQADGREALTADSPLERLGIRGGLHSGGAEVDREEHGGRVKQLQPPHVPFRREVRTLRVVRGRAELGMVIEVPARELRRRDPGGKRVDEAEEAIGAWSVAVEDGLVDDLVKEDRSVEDDEAEDERARHAHPEALEMPAERERGGEEDELAEGDREMARGAFLMQRPQDVVRHGGREPLPQISDRVVEVPGLHSGTGYAGRKEKALPLNSRNAPCSNRRRVWSGLLSPHFLRDEIERPALHFVRDPAEVLPEDADDGELHAAQEKDEDHERRPAGHVELQDPDTERHEDVEKRE